MSFRSLLLASSLLAVATIVSAAQPDDFRADHLDFDLSTSEAIGRGNARLVYDGAVLTADEVRFNQKTQVATAVGHVTLTRGARRLLADKIVYRLATNSFDVEALRLGDFPLYLSAKNVSGDREKIIAQDATLTYHEPTLLGPSLHARTLTYEAGKKIRAEGARIGVGPLLPIPLSHFEQNVNEPLISYLEGTVGYRNSLGAYFDAGAHAPFYPGVNAGGHVAWYSKRGFLVGPSGTYRVATAAGPAEGELNTGYINDHGERLTDTIGKPIGANRAYIDWTHRQRLGESTTLFGQLHYWSDSDVMRDFYPDTFYTQQQPDSFLEADHTGDNFALTLFSRVQPNSYALTQQRLPEVRFDLFPTALGHGIYEMASVSAAVLTQSSLLDSPRLRSTRLDAYYAIERPTTPVEWFTFDPVAGVRVTDYLQATSGKSTYVRTLGEFGFDAKLRASGTFDYKNPVWQIDGIRHLVTPGVSYRYIPGSDSGTAYIPSIDDEVFATYLKPLGLGDSRAVDSLQSGHIVRLSLENLFQTRDKTYGSRDLLSLTFASDFHIDKQAGEDDFSNLQTELAFTPAKWISFNLFNRVDAASMTTREINTGFTLTDGNAWTARLATHYLQHQIQEYVAEGNYRLNEVYQVGTKLHFDSRKSRFVEQSYHVTQNLDNLWKIRYGMSIYNGARRESSFGFNISVELAGF